MPVSTTHILSSAVAGTIVANKSGLQTPDHQDHSAGLVLTLPLTMLLSGGLFLLNSHLFGG